MDISDRATGEEFDRHIAMLKHASHAPGLPVTGRHWCDALLPAGALLRRRLSDDWQREPGPRQRGSLL